MSIEGNATSALGGVMNEPELLPYLDNLGNTEGKVLLAAIVHADPGRIFGGADLHNEFVGRQGDIPVRVPTISVSMRTCVRSLLPLGAIVKMTKIVGKNEVAASRAVAEQSPQVLAFCGAIMRWSVDHPDHSVQPMLGKSSGGTRQYSPSIRYQVYDRLLARGGLSARELFPTLRAVEGYKIDSLEDQLERMSSLGMVRRASVGESVPTDIDQDWREPIQGFFAQMRLLGKPKEFGRNIDYALEAIASRAVVRLLVKKDFDFSTNRRTTDVRFNQVKPLEETLLALLTAHGEITARQARDALKVTEDFNYDIENITTAFRKLRRKGLVQASYRTPEMAPKAVLHYSLSDTEPK